MPRFRAYSAARTTREIAQQHAFQDFERKETAWFMANTNSTTCIQVYAIRLPFEGQFHLESTWTLKLLSKLSDPRCLFMASVVLVNAWISTFLQEITHNNKSDGWKAIKEMPQKQQNSHISSQDTLYKFVKYLCRIRHSRVPWHFPHRFCTPRRCLHLIGGKVSRVETPKPDIADGCKELSARAVLIVVPVVVPVVVAAVVVVGCWLLFLFLFLLLLLLFLWLFLLFVVTAVAVAVVDNDDVVAVAVVLGVNGGDAVEDACVAQMFFWCKKFSSKLGSKICCRKESNKLHPSAGR